MDTDLIWIALTIAVPILLIKVLFFTDHHPDKRLPKGMRYVTHSDVDPFGGSYSYTDTLENGGFTLKYKDTKKTLFSNVT
jgi:hypothetical protein